MSTITKDFSGEYDWPAVEAKSQAELFNEYIFEYPHSELIEQLFKLSYHWLMVFGEDDQGQADMKRFTEVFNSLVSDEFHI